ncbi:MAG TPA: ribosome recycling factor [Rickettsiales bacterium]|nr:ribosome recycling factor [Rickettsiales bacterium]
MSDNDISGLRKRMEGAMKTLAHEFAGLRTGRASVNLLDTVMVEAYGSMMPLNQVANVNVPEARLLSVQVWDKGMMKAVEKAIANANLGLNPAADGQTVRVPIPELSQERRVELIKIAGKYAESSKVSVRNIRRDGMEYYKKLEKDSDISKDELHQKSDEIQKLTDEFIKKIDDTLAVKEKEIMPS